MIRCGVLFCVAILLVHPYKSLQYGHGSGSVSGSYSSSSSSSSSSAFSSSSSYSSSGSFAKTGNIPNDINSIGFLNGLGNSAFSGAHSAAGASTGALAGASAGALAGASSGAFSGTSAGAGSYAGSKGGVKGSDILKKHGLGVGGGVGIAGGDSLVGTGDFGSAAIKANCGKNACGDLGTGHLPVENGPDVLENGGLGGYADNDKFKIGPHKPSGYDAKTNNGAGVGGGIGVGPGGAFLGGSVKDCGPSGCGTGSNQQPGGIACSGSGCLQVPSKNCGHGGCGPDSLVFPGTIGGSYSGPLSSPGFVTGSVVISKPGQPASSLHFASPGLSGASGCAPGTSGCSQTIKPSSVSPGYTQAGSPVPKPTVSGIDVSSGVSPVYNQPGSPGFTSPGFTSSGSSKPAYSIGTSGASVLPSGSGYNQGGCAPGALGCTNAPSSSQTQPIKPTGTSPDYNQPGSGFASPGSPKPGYSQGTSGTPIIPSGSPYNQQGCAPGALGCSNIPSSSQTQPIKPSGTSPNYNQPGSPGFTSPGSSKPGYNQGSLGSSISPSGSPYNQQGCAPGAIGCSSIPSTSQTQPIKPGYSQGTSGTPIISSGSPYNQQGCAPGALGCSSIPSSFQTQPIKPSGTSPNYNQPGSPGFTSPGSSKPGYSQGSTGSSLSPSGSPYNQQGCAPGAIGCSSIPSSSQTQPIIPSNVSPGFASPDSSKPGYSQTPSGIQQGSSKYPSGCAPGQPGCGSVPVQTGSYAGSGAASTSYSQGASSSTSGGGTGSYTPSCGPNAVNCQKPGEHKLSTELEAPLLIPGPGSVPSSVSKIIPDSGFHYTGPFPGPQGSILESKPTRRPSGPITSVPALIHRPELPALKPGYDVGSSPSKPEDGFHYTGSFPGRPGSILESKPAGQKPGYGGSTTIGQPAQPTPQQPGYGGSTPTGQPVYPTPQKPGYGGTTPIGQTVHPTPQKPGYGGSTTIGQPAQPTPQQPGYGGIAPTGQPAKPGTIGSYPVYPDSGEGVHYTGPFPGPVGSIDTSKPATGVKPFAHADSTAHAGTNAHKPAPTAPTYPGTSGTDTGVHYTGSFPGPSGSIHSSKPAGVKSGAHAGTTAGSIAPIHPGSPAGTVPSYSGSTAGSSASASSTASAGSYSGGQGSTAPTDSTKPGYPGSPGYGSKPSQGETDTPIVRVIPTSNSKPDTSVGVSDEYLSKGCGGAGCGDQPGGSVGGNGELGPSKTKPCASGNCDLKANVGQGCGGSGCAGGVQVPANAFAGSAAYSSSGAFSSSGSQGVSAPGGHGGSGCSACSGLQSLLNGFGASSSGAGSYSGTKGGSHSGSKSSAYSSSSSGSYGGAHSGSFSGSYASSGSHAGHY